MKRYELNDKFKEDIINSPYSQRHLSRILGFEIKNIVSRNKSIREDHLEKLTSFLKIKHKLNEINFNYAKNFGKYAETQPLKNVVRDKNLAEIIGIMLGDGNLNRNRVRVCFDKRNIRYMQYVKYLFKGVFGVDLREEIIKKTNQAYLYCYNKFLMLELINLGLKKGDKIKNKLTIPDWIKENEEYSASCIKGLIDTDGCIYFSKRDKQTYIKFTNFNLILLKDFKILTDKLNYRFAKANKNNFCLYRKEEVARFINDIQPVKSVQGVVV